jgi:hypothetical protein
MNGRQPACRLPGPNDPLTLREQDELEARLASLLGHAARFPVREPTTILRCEVENVARMMATLQFYRGILATHRDLATLDAALPPRVTINGIAYLTIEHPEKETRESGE